MIIEIKKPLGKILKTKDALCDDDIIVVPVLQSKTVNQNGPVKADDGYAGLAEVIVQVDGAGGGVGDGTVGGVEYETLNCDLDFVDPISEEVARQMSFVAPEGTAYKSVYINRPATLIPKHIRKGIKIAGVVGSFEPVVENVVRYPYAEGVMF